MPLKLGTNFVSFNMINSKKILILGANGMAGNSVFNELSKNKNLNVFGTVRKMKNSDYFLYPEKIIQNLEIEKKDEFYKFLITFEPKLVINCIGITKHNEKKISNYF